MLYPVLLLVLAFIFTCFPQVRAREKVDPSFLLGSLPESSGTDEGEDDRSKYLKGSLVDSQYGSDENEDIICFGELPTRPSFYAEGYSRTDWDGKPQRLCAFNGGNLIQGNMHLRCKDKTLTVTPDDPDFVPFIEDAVFLVYCFLTCFCKGGDTPPREGQWGSILPRWLAMVEQGETFLGSVNDEGKTSITVLSSPSNLPASPVEVGPSTPTPELDSNEAGPSTIRPVLDEALVEELDLGGDFEYVTVPGYMNVGWIVNAQGQEVGIWDALDGTTSVDWWATPVVDELQQLPTPEAASLSPLSGPLSTYWTNPGDPTRGWIYDGQNRPVGWWNSDHDGEVHTMMFPEWANNPLTPEVVSASSTTSSNSTISSSSSQGIKLRGMHFSTLPIPTLKNPQGWVVNADGEVLGVWFDGDDGKRTCDFSPRSMINLDSCPVMVSGCDVTQEGQCSRTDSGVTTRVPQATPRRRQRYRPKAGEAQPAAVRKAPDQARETPYLPPRQRYNPQKCQRQCSSFDSGTCGGGCECRSVPDRRNGPNLWLGTCMAVVVGRARKSGLLQFDAGGNLAGSFGNSLGKRDWDWSRGEEEDWPCPCNETYVSHACCEARNGMVWEGRGGYLGGLSGRGVAI